MAARKKRVIQVPMEENFLEALDRLSQGRRISRSELIREACRRYIAESEQARLDKAYEEGYRHLPEEPAIGEGQLAVAMQVLAEDSW